MIEGLLESLEKQTVKIKTEDVYVIVETKDDPTVEICRKHGAGVFVRPKVTLSRARKGFALAVVGGAFVLLYIILAGVTVHILRQEKLDLARSMKIKIVLFNPLYLVTYVPCALKALLRREVAWVKIEHGAEQP